MESTQDRIRGRSRFLPDIVVFHSLRGSPLPAISSGTSQNLNNCIRIDPLLHLGFTSAIQADRN